jgi:hypothetical protein
VRVAFYVLGVVVMLWLLSALTSFLTSSVAATAMALGCGCSTLLLATNPESLLRSVSAAETRRALVLQTSAGAVLSKAGLVCMLTAVVTWMLGV